MDSNSKGRRRYQRGSLILKGSREKVWYIRWLEDVIEDGVLRRVHRSNRVGTIEQFPTKMDAWREAEQIVSKVNDSEYRPRTILTFNDMATTWQTNVMVLHKPASQASEKGHISFHLIPFFGKLLLTEIRSETVQRFISTSKLAPKSIRNVLDTFRLIWKSAKAWGYVKHDPLENVTKPRLLADTQPVYSVEQMRQIIQFTGEPYKTMFWVLAETGMRGGEACGLCVDDLNFDDRMIVVRRSTFRGKLQTPKTATAVRAMSISESLTSHLKLYLQRDYRKNPDRLLFASRQGKPLDNSNVVKYALRPVTDRLGFPAAGLHALRHGNATALDRMGTPVAVRMERLGHTKFDMTMRYSHAVSADHKAVADQFGRLLQPRIVFPSLPLALPPAPNQ